MRKGSDDGSELDTVEVAKPKPPTARAAMALAKSRAYQDAADAPAMLKAYVTDLANFTAWRAANGLADGPTTPQIVGAYEARPVSEVVT